jgi:CubicO group peptidase (beta-lactamase class C family)
LKSRQLVRNLHCRLGRPAALEFRDEGGVLSRSGDPDVWVFVDNRLLPIERRFGWVRPLLFFEGVEVSHAMTSQRFRVLCQDEKLPHADTCQACLGESPGGMAQRTNSACGFVLHTLCGNAPILMKPNASPTAFKPRLTRAVQISLLSALFSLLPAGAPAADQGHAADVLQRYVDRHLLAGAVTLVASRDKVLGVEAVGYSDLASHKPMQTDDLFWIASMTKAMTCAGLMMLVDEGKVRIDDPVDKYLPELHDQWVVAESDADHSLWKKPRHPITIKNLLTHTSGFVPKSAIEHPKVDIIPLRNLIPSFVMAPLHFEPGSKYEYCNAGMNTAGRIIEVASGLSYGDFMEQRLFRPLGMTHTTFWPSEEQLKTLAKTYDFNPEKTDLVESGIEPFTYPLSDHNRQPLPAGGAFSTAADLGRFCQMLLGGGVIDGKRILSADAVRQMSTVETGDIKLNGNDFEGYGFGLVVRKKPGAEGMSAGSFGHRGAYKTAMWMDPAKNRILIFLMQHSGSLSGTDATKMESAFEKAALERYHD